MNAPMKLVALPPRPFEGLSLLAVAPVIMASLFGLLLAGSIGLGDAGLSFLEVGLALQGLALACCGASLALQAHGQLQAWERRCAPATGARRVLTRLRLGLFVCLLIGLVGPLALVHAVEWRDGVPQLLRIKALASALLLMVLAQLAGAGATLAWLGRAPRLWLLALLPLSAALLMMETLWQALPSLPLAPLSLIAALLIGAAWGWLGDAAAISRRGSALISGAWLATGRDLWRSMQPRWQSLPFEDQAITTGKRQYALTVTPQEPPSALPNWTLALILLAQLTLLHPQLQHLLWQQAWDGSGALRHGVWLGYLLMLAALGLASDDLHWRRTLAPGGLRRRRFGLRLLLCSLARWALLLSLCLAGALALRPYEPAAATQWLSALPGVAVDLLLVTAAAACLRAWCNRRVVSVVGGLAFGLLAWAALLLAEHLGWQAVRGAGLLLAEALLALALALLAMRLWARYDLGRLNAQVPERR